MQEPGFHRGEGVDLVPCIMEELAAAGLDAAAFPTRVILQSFQLSVRRQPGRSSSEDGSDCNFPRTGCWTAVRLVRT